jgi:hypothetical protein
MTATMEDGSAHELFLRIWLSDRQMLRREFDEIVAH